MTEKKTDEELVIIVADNKSDKDENNKFFDFLFSRNIPMKIIVQRSMLENGNFPLKYIDSEKLLPLHGDNFIKEAKKRAAGKRIIVFRNPRRVPDGALEKLFSVSGFHGKLFELAAKIIL